jgi:hypothetical protein
MFLNTTKNCAPNSCWGDPVGFLNNLSESTFIHVVDQYTGNSGDNRYPVGKNYNVTYPTKHGVPLTDSDMQKIAYAAAVKSGQFGYGHIYHIFLVPGQDECFDTTYTVCYSPDKPKTWIFCAYHGSFVVKGFAEVVYTVEPYQNVKGCAVAPGTPNGQLADSTNDVLSHEVFETITDPDGTAWWNVLNGALFGQEIGDECVFLAFNSSGKFVGSDPSLVTLNGKHYAVQPEENNSQHACTTAP